MMKSFVENCKVRPCFLNVNFKYSMVVKSPEAAVRMPALNSGSVIVLAA